MGVHPAILSKRPLHCLPKNPPIGSVFRPEDMFRPPHVSRSSLWGHLCQFLREPKGVGRPEIFSTELQLRRKDRREGGPTPLPPLVVTRKKAEGAAPIYLLGRHLIAPTHPSSLIPHPAAHTVGRREIHGLAFSSCAANERSKPSSPYAADSCTPTGRPSEPVCSGSEIAGCPV